MEQYVGLDVSQKETAVSVIDAEGTKLWAGKCRSVPAVIAELVREKAPWAKRVGQETGPLAVWHWHELKRLRVSVVCLHARHAKEGFPVKWTTHNWTPSAVDVGPITRQVVTGVERLRRSDPPDVAWRTHSVSGARASCVVDADCNRR